MEYKPFSQKQLTTLCWWNYDKYKHHDALVCDGYIRSGKTLSMSFGFQIPVPAFFIVTRRTFVW